MREHNQEKTLSKTGAVWVFGYGAFSSRQLAVGLFDRLSNLDQIFTIIKEPVGVWLPKELYGRKIDRLSSLFTNTKDRNDNYQRIAEHVVKSARENKIVAYISYGSPVVYDRIVGSIVLKCAKENIPCQVIPTTSSVDASLAFLGEDMAPGLQICEAKWLVDKSIHLDTKLASFLFQLSVFCTDGIAHPDDLNITKLTPLRDYLLNFYPSNHPCIFVRAPFDLGDPGHFSCRRLQDFVMGSLEDLMDTSLYLPSIEDFDSTYKKWKIMAAENSATF